VTGEDISSLWAELAVDELRKCGVELFCASSGLRNLPLISKAVRNSRIQVRFFVDERCAAFFAQGYGKATGRPAVAVCTSGTAVANYLPAVVEASYSASPMILMTADRPLHLIDSGANQTIDQRNVFGKFVRWSCDIVSPTTDVTLEIMLGCIDHAIERSRRAPMGPVHLNFRMPDPLTNSESGHLSEAGLNHSRTISESDRPFRTFSRPSFAADSEEFDTVRKALVNSRRGLIIVGCLNHSRDRKAIARLTTSLKMPVCACISSGIRFGDRAAISIMGSFDLFLRVKEFAIKYRPDLILHLGGQPISKHLLKYAAQSCSPYILISDGPTKQDPYGGVTHRISMSPVDFCEAFSYVTCDDESELLGPFRSAEDICADVIRANALNDVSSELDVVMAVLDEIPSGYGVFIGNSMPVRDADFSGFTSSRDISICVNRGASGIDGNIASAAGFAQGIDSPVVAIVGDLALIHDINSLALLSQGSTVHVVVINNNGGGIYSVLPLKAEDGNSVRVAHGLTFEGAPSMFDLSYSRPVDIPDLRRVCRETFPQSGSSLSEVITDRDTNASLHHSLFERVAVEIRGRLLHDS
jgi:2-succinyl-5-enolpyruvyl-6-hydroxy-3-cyclohexene-1-carboxylate synthase